MAINPVWPFTPQPNKWAYPNNPRWTNTPLAPINYDGRESEEPQVWTLNVQSPRSANGSNQHIPCGHWHKIPVGGGGDVANVAYGVVIGMNRETGRTVLLDSSPLTRVVIRDHWASEDYPARCYGITYDYANGVVYAGINDTNDNGSVKIVKMDSSNLAILDTLTLVAPPNETKNVEIMADYVENGLIYALVKDNNVYNDGIFFEIQISDFTVSRQLTPPILPRMMQSNALHPDSERGFIYYVKRITDYDYDVVRFNLTTFTEDAVWNINLPATIIFWGVSADHYDKAHGNLYVTWAEKDFGYYSTYFVLGEFNVDSGTLVRSLQLPTLPSGYALQPRRITKSNSYLYILGTDMNPVGNPPPYLMTIDLVNWNVVTYPQIPNTADGVNAIVFDSVGGDIGIKGDELIAYIHARSTGPDNTDSYAVYKVYDISDGIPTQTQEVLFQDPYDYETGDYSSNLVIEV